MKIYSFDLSLNLPHINIYISVLHLLILKSENIMVVCHTSENNNSYVNNLGVTYYI